MLDGAIPSTWSAPTCAHWDCWWWWAESHFYTWLTYVAATYGDHWGSKPCDVREEPRAVASWRINFIFNSFSRSDLNESGLGYRMRSFNSAYKFVSKSRCALHGVYKHRALVWERLPPMWEMVFLSRSLRKFHFQPITFVHRHVLCYATPLPINKIKNMWLDYIGHLSLYQSADQRGIRTTRQQSDCNLSHSVPKIIRVWHEILPCFMVPYLLIFNGLFEIAERGFFGKSWIVYGLVPGGLRFCALLTNVTRLRNNCAMAIVLDLSVELSRSVRARKWYLPKPVGFSPLFALLVLWVQLAL